MTPAELTAWQKRNGLRTDAEAALALGMSAKTYWRKRHGLTEITRQTELLCQYFEVLQRSITNLMLVGETSYKLVRLANLQTNSRRSGDADCFPWGGK